ncbi:MAG: DUF4281 domain-containing protein [Sandaracinaceae bacterium]|nr:DUF4281 domain-containing protein [Sandaracinaceae bacterium]
MGWDDAFTIANASVLPAWLLLILAPRARVTKILVHSVVIPIALGIAYAILLFGDPDGSGGMDLAGVMRALRSERTFVAAWIHYLIFDLFVASWQVRDAARRGIAHWKIVPSLIVTLFFGPVGLVSYAVIRLLHKQGIALDET